jgi:isohexenylglutaconyl-CoA hydratase
MVMELLAMTEAASSDDSGVRAIVLRGAGGHFCAGGDLKEVMAGSAVSSSDDPIAALSRSFGLMLQALSRCPAVVIAVCEGSVAGGGFGIACVADITLTVPTARFALPETRRGLPPAQIAPFVAERIGLMAARRLCLTGATLDGLAAVRLGIASECCEDASALEAALRRTITDVLACAPQANATTKRLLLKLARTDLDGVLDEAAQLFSDCVRGPEAPEGIAAFLQKREPRWAR